MQPYTTTRAIAITMGLALWAVESWFLVDAAAYEFSPSVAAIPLATAALAFIPMAFERASGLGVRLAMVASALLLAGHVAGAVIERTGSSLDAKIGQAKATGQARKLIEDEITETRRRLSIAEAEVIRESRNQGCKATCEGWRRAVRERQARIDQLTSELADAPAEVPGDSVASRINALTFGFVHADTASLWRPLLLPFGCLLAIWSLLGFGFRPVHGGSDKFKAVNDNPPADKVPVPEIEESTEDKVIDWAARFKKVHGRLPSQSEIRSAFGLAKSTTHKLYHERIAKAA